MACQARLQSERDTRISRKDDAHHTRHVARLRARAHTMSVTTTFLRHRALPLQRPPAPNSAEHDPPPLGTPPAPTHQAELCVIACENSRSLEQKEHVASPLIAAHKSTESAMKCRAQNRRARSQDHMRVIVMLARNPRPCRIPSLQVGVRWTSRMWDG